jgi:flagellar motor switch protein FliM
MLTNEEKAALAESFSDSSEAGYNKIPVRKYDLAVEDSAVGINLSAIDMINERFIRLFRLSMLETLRTGLRMTPLKARVSRFGEYLTPLKPPMSVNVIRMNPLRGYVMLVIDPVVVFSSLDNFFGGFGAGGSELAPGRLFTQTESRIINMVLQAFFGSSKEAWSPIIKVEYEHVSSEINPQFAQIADEDDQVVISRFEVDMGANKSSGFVDLVIPYVSLKPMRDLLRSRVQTGDGNEESDRQWHQLLFNSVNSAELTARVLIGKVDISLKQLSSLKEGEMLYFNRFDQAKIVVKDIPVFSADVGEKAKNYAVKIVGANKLIKQIEGSRYE